MQTLNRQTLKKNGIYSGIIVLVVGLLAGLFMSLRAGTLYFGMYISPHVIGQFVLLGGALAAIGGAWLGSNTAHFEDDPNVAPDAHKRGQKFIDRLGIRAVAFVGIFGLFAGLAALADAFSGNPYFTRNLGKVIEGVASISFFVFGATMSVTLSSLFSTIFRNRYLTTFLTTLGFGALAFGTAMSADRLADFLTRSYTSKWFFFIVFAVLTVSVINLLLTFWALKRVKGTK
jgi:hypothetical protein